MSQLQEAVDRRVELLAKEDVPRRIWAGDHTVWRPDPTEIVDRLGWLTVHEEMRGLAEDLREFARGCANDGLKTAVLAGMGGSSLAGEVFRESLGVTQGFLDLVVLDTTHPDQILAVERSLELPRTLFVVASKSGTTVETRSHLEYFWRKLPDGAHFAAITDPGSPLEDLAGERGFRRTFLNRPDIGGRHSALSMFGLVPAALVGAELEPLLDGASGMASVCGPEVQAADNPAIRLGAWMAEAVLAGRDKLTMVLPDAVASFGWWAEQLLAESTGKEGTGVVPIEGESLGPPGMYGEDRLFVTLGGAGRGPIVGWLERAAHPIVRLPFEGPHGLGAEMFRWEFAAAVAAAALGIHPFDQPDVRSAKDATSRLLVADEVPEIDPGDLRALVDGVRSGHYVAIQAYLPRNGQTRSRLQAVRLRIRDETRLATTVGFGPRLLHSTGQLHKGGPPTGLFVQVVAPPAGDAAIPGEDYTFGELLAAQAAGDLEALRARGRRAVRVALAELEESDWS